MSFQEILWAIVMMVGLGLMLTEGEVNLLGITIFLVGIGLYYQAIKKRTRK
jgi:hypothetical protein